MVILIRFGKCDFQRLILRTQTSNPLYHQQESLFCATCLYHNMQKMQVKPSRSMPNYRTLVSLFMFLQLSLNLMKKLKNLLQAYKPLFQCCIRRQVWASNKHEVRIFFVCCCCLSFFKIWTKQKGVPRPGSGIWIYLGMKCISALPWWSEHLLGSFSFLSKNQLKENLPWLSQSKATIIDMINCTSSN